MKTGPKSKIFGRITDAKRRELILRANDLARTGNYTASEIADKLGVSRATLFRWRSDRIKKSNFSDLRFVNNAITNLLNATESDNFRLVESVASLSIWIRMPDSVELFDEALLMILFSYYRALYRTDLISLLPDDVRDGIVSNIKLDKYSNGFINQGIILPEFDYINLLDYKITERDIQFYLIETILSWSDDFGRLNLENLIDKTLEIIRLKYASLPRRMVEITWKERIHSAPFVYIEYTSSSLDWNLNPFDGRFCDQLADLCADPQEIVRYLRRVEEIYRVLAERLSRRALKFLRTPTFS